jgi:hypothetical protein
VVGTLDYFPVLISLDEATSGLNGVARSDGHDILFTLDDGVTKIPHEIESYSDGNLVAWVRVPSINSVTDTRIMMYYGYPDAEDQQDVANVWNDGGSDYFKGVWHMHNDAITESTKYPNDGTNSGTTDYAGQIDRGRYFTSSSSNRISVADDASLHISGPLTVEAWVYPASSYNWRTVVSKFTGSQADLYFVFDAGQLVVNLNGPMSGDWYTDLGYSTGSYQHFAITYDGSNIRAYKNGGQDYDILGGSGSLTLASNTNPLYMGYNTAYNEYWRGAMDEIRISAANRSYQWIKTEYNNQLDPSSFYTLTDLTEAPCTGGSSSLPAAWNNCSWQERKKITIDHTKVISGDKSNFPVLISLPSDSGLENHAQSDGGDIYFTDSNGNKLSHEIENYTSSNGALIAWVKVPTLSSSTNTVLYMYYGNPSVTNRQDKTGTWDTNFVMVQHMNGASAAALNDSTINYNHVTSQIGGPAYLQAGQVGYAVSFDGNDAVEAKDSATLDITSQSTVCAWIRPAVSHTTWNRIVAKSYTSNNPPYTMYGLLYNDNNRIRVEIASGSTQYGSNGVTSIPNPSTWTYACAVYDHSDVRVYVNGNTEGTPTSLSGNIDTDNMPLSIGRSGYNMNYFTGRIDEVRVSSTGRLPGWIMTEYNTMSSPSTFFSLADEEPAPCSPPPTTLAVPTPVQTPSPPWYPYCGWRYRKNITIDKNRVVLSQSNFPVLVSIPADNDLKAHARTDGRDILFTSDDGQTTIPYDREGWDSTTGAFTAWVKVPQIQSTDNTTIFMYYGFLSAPDMSTPTDVWSDYVGVWHLNNSFLDSTSYANTGTDYGSDDISGKIGRGRDYHSNQRDYTDIPKNYASGSGLNITGNALTVEAWIYPSSWSDWYYSEAIAGKDEWSPGVHGYALRAGRNTDVHSGNGAISFNVSNSSANAGWMVTYTNGFMSTGQWYFVAGTYNNSYVAAFINGHASYNITKQYPAGGGNIANSLYEFNIADSSSSRLKLGTTKGKYFDGFIDEVRVSSVARSDNWITTEYNNQISPTTFAYPQKEENYVCGGIPAPAYVQSWSHSYGGQNPVQITLPGLSTAGDLYVLSFLYDSQTITYSSITDSQGNTYTSVAGPTSLGGWGRSYTFYAKNIAGGSQPVTATIYLSGTPPSVFDVFLSEYAGVDTISPLDQQSTGTGNGQPMDSGAKFVAKVPQLIYGFGAADYPCTPDLPYAARENTNGEFAADMTAFSTGTYRVTGTQPGSGQWILQMATFKGA